LFPPLRYDTPIGVFASRFKAVVTEQGYVIVKPTAEELMYGPQLRINVAGRPIENATISQRYTNDAALAVQTDYQWRDVHLRLRAFGAEPESAGFFVIGELTSTNSQGASPGVEMCLENIKGGRLLQDSIIVNDEGQQLLNAVPLDNGADAAGVRL